MGAWKKFAAGAITSAVVASGLGVAAAGALAVHLPAVQATAATFQLKAVNVFSPAHCAGADGQEYITYRGALAGTETAPSATAPGYTLTGALTVKGIIWTVNTVTGRGVFRGTATLVNPATSTAAASTTYSGLITLVTQEPVPASTSGAVHRTTPTGVARGWINAATFTNGKADGGSLLANVQATFGPGLGVSGEFGGSAAAPDLSLITDNVAC